MAGRLEIKICGLTNLADAHAALEAGADWLGFVLYRHSARAVAPAALARMAGRLEGARLVGVFVNAAAAVVARVAEDCGLAAVQLHGDERQSAYRELTVPVWRALRLQGRNARPDPRRWPAQRYVVDAAALGRYGGTGLTVDWTAAGALARRQPVMLAGGLTPENVAGAVRRARPLGVDVAGGVERCPGRKDRRKLREFVRAAGRGMI